MARVLVAEDDDAMREFLLHALMHWGHEVDVVSGGDQALGLLAAGAYDLVLADVRMPGEDGVTVARRALSARPDTPILFITGYPNEVRRAKDVMQDRTAVLPKPFMLKELNQTVHRLLARPDHPVPHRPGGGAKAAA